MCSRWRITLCLLCYSYSVLQYNTSLFTESVTSLHRPVPVTHPTNLCYNSPSKISHLLYRFFVCCFFHEVLLFFVRSLFSITFKRRRPTRTGCTPCLLPRPILLHSDPVTLYSVPVPSSCSEPTTNLKSTPRFMLLFGPSPDTSRDRVESTSRDRHHTLYLKSLVLTLLPRGFSRHTYRRHNP